MTTNDQHGFAPYPDDIIEESVFQIDAILRKLDAWCGTAPLEWGSPANSSVCLVVENGENHRDVSRAEAGASTPADLDEPSDNSGDEPEDDIKWRLHHLRSLLYQQHRIH